MAFNVEILSHVSGLIEAFKAFDSDNDGRITAEELGGILQSLGYGGTTNEDLREMIAAVKGDAIEDGMLSLGEFLDMNTKELDVCRELVASLGDALRELGSCDDDSTVITGEDLHGALPCMESLSLEDCMDIIASIDGDGDGAVSLEEFKLIVSALL